MSQEQEPRKQEDLDREEQTKTDGGGILGGDDSTSSLTSVVGANLHSSHTDEDGETTSNNLGGALGTDTNSVNQNN